MKRFSFYVFYVLLTSSLLFCFSCVFTPSGNDELISVTVCNKTNESIRIFSYTLPLITGTEIKSKTCQSCGVFKGDTIEARGCTTGNNYGIYVFKNSGETWFVQD